MSVDGCACTDAERRTAARLHDELRSRGHTAWVETHWVRPQRQAVLALGCALAVAGSLLSAVAPAAGPALAAVALVSLAFEAFGRVGPLRLLFPRRATQHVLTAPPETGGVLLVTAPYDAPRGGRAIGELGQSILVACAAVVAGATVARASGFEDTWLGAVQLAPTLALLAALAVAADAAASGPAPSEDAACRVAVALALFDELAREPPPGLAPALLLAGAGHAEPRVLADHLRHERLRGRAVVVEPSPCGGAGEARALELAREAVVRAIPSEGMVAARAGSGNDSQQRPGSPLRSGNTPSEGAS